VFEPWVGQLRDARGLQNAKPAWQRWYQQSAFYLEPIAHADRVCGPPGFVDDERNGAHTPGGGLDATVELQ